MSARSTPRMRRQKFLAFYARFPINLLLYRPIPTSICFSKPFLNLLYCSQQARTSFLPRGTRWFQCLLFYSSICKYQPMMLKKFQFHWLTFKRQPIKIVVVDGFRLKLVSRALPAKRSWKSRLEHWNEWDTSVICGWTSVFNLQNDAVL